MHLIMILLGCTLAWISRQWGMEGWQRQLHWVDGEEPSSVATSPSLPLPQSNPTTWGLTTRWRLTLGLFLSAPLWLATTAIAILWMGPVGEMVIPWEGLLSYGTILGICVLSGAVGLKLWWEGRQTLEQLQHYPEITILGHNSRLLPYPLPYSAQVGFWQPHLVVTQGLLDTLDDQHLEAVLVHEQAHALSHDTFWFFWLGWLRRLTWWLPHTEFLWEELLMLRELRADHYAAQFTDPLLLAESLVILAAAPTSAFPIPVTMVAAFESPCPPNRLIQRLTALISTPNDSPPARANLLFGLLPSLLPLIMIPFHH